MVVVKTFFVAKYNSRVYYFYRGDPSMFPERLKEARKAKKLSQKEMASLIFLSQQAYAKYEVGTAKPNSETLAKIAAALDVSVDYLLDVQPSAKSPADDVSETKKAMHDLVDELPDDKVLKLYDIAKAALAL